MTFLVIWCLMVIGMVLNAVIVGTTLLLIADPDQDPGPQLILTAAFWPIGIPLYLGGRLYDRLILAAHPIPELGPAAVD